MDKKIYITLILALFLITSNNSVLGTTQKCTIDNESYLCLDTINLTKSVWSEGAWQDYIEDVEIGSSVRFNITLIYYSNPQNPDDLILQDIVILDELPACLVFAENITFFNAPIIDEEQNGNIIIWNFTNFDFNLSDEETMSIEFDAIVVETQEVENENVAYGSGLEDDVYLSDEENAWIYVYIPPPPEPLEVEKKVYDPETGQWSDYLDAVIKGTIVRFNPNNAVVEFIKGSGKISEIRLDFNDFSKKI